MKELEMIKAFAKLEGVTLEYPQSNEVPFYRYRGSGVTHLCEYNPLTDFTLTFKAMVKYKVQKITEVYNGVEFNTFHIGGESRITVSDDKLIPKAIIQCILKSEGLWK